MNYNIFGKDFIIFAGMITLFIFSIIVLYWTSLPILTNIFSEQPRAADLATYNEFALPFAIIFSLFLIVAPYLSYNGYNPEGWKNKFIISIR